MSRHFCCCIPVRVAVFITSLLGLLFSTLVGASAIYVLIETKNENDPTVGNLTQDQKIVLIVLAVVYPLIALVSLFGFIGSIIRKRSFVALYSTMTIVAFLVQSGSDAWFLYNVFRKDSRLQCTTTNDTTTTDPALCKDVLRDVRWIMVAFLALMWIIQLYIVVVIRRYVTQLDEEQNYYRASHTVNYAFNMAPTGAPAHYPHQKLEQDQSFLVGPTGPYPYSDPHKSFGPHV